MLLVFLDCQFLIAPSVFSNVYYISKRFNILMTYLLILHIKTLFEIKLILGDR
jgi:hypothetical protein